VEIAGKDGLEERTEDNLRAIGLGESHPQNKDELEGVVEGEPVNGTDSTLEDVQEGVDNPVRQPLGVVDGAAGEQRVEGVVGRNDEANCVHKKLGSDIEEDQEEVQGAESEHDIDLGHVGASLKVSEDFVFSELLIKLGNADLGTVLQRHLGRMQVAELIWRGIWGVPDVENVKIDDGVGGMEMPLFFFLDLLRA